MFWLMATIPRTTANAYRGPETGFGQSEIS